ncbi:MAG: hypothetical protein MUF60_01035 [Vicinamibacterales bacterium]|nr:hypothetical protein [Vicinamibacterales bacterium]
MSAVSRTHVAYAAAGLLSLALALPASAQSPTAKTQPARPPAGQPPASPPKPAPAKAVPAPGTAAPPAFHVAAFFEGGFQTFAASDTFEATLGTSSGSVIGGGGSLTHRSGLFVQVDYTRFSADGERAFAYGGEVYKLGIPLRVEVNPLEFSVGYKFFVSPRRAAPAAPPPSPPKPAVQPAGARPGGTAGAPVQKPAPARPPAPTRASKPPFGGLKPYVGGGIGIVRYRETSDFATGDENVDDGFTSYHVIGGVEVPVWRWLGAAAEVNYRWVGDAFGKAGLSQEFGEDDLGGLSLRFKVTVGR